MRAAARALVATAAALLLLAASAPVRGTFALAGGTQKARAFLIDAGGASTLDRRLVMWMERPTGSAPIRRYDVDMTQLLHLVVVSDDLATFAHVHPVLGSDGRFRIEQRFPRVGLYHLYADGEPVGSGQQVFRFELPVGGATVGIAEHTLAATGATARAGPYVVQLASTTVRAQHDAPVAVHVRANGAPARDLHPYLGALAHAVLVSAADLSYVHVHAMPAGGMNDMSFDDMPGMSMDDMKMKPLPANARSAPDMVLHVRLPAAGSYALWFQFRGANALHVARFTITVR
jgi:hypothetical protein